MTSKNLLSPVSTAVFLSALLSVYIQNPQRAYASSSAITSVVTTTNTPISLTPQDGFAQSTEVADSIPVDQPVSRAGNASHYRVFGTQYTVLAAVQAKNFKQAGTASWYGKQFHGRRTSSGERFDMYQLTAAHRNLPIPCYARVTNQANGKSVIVKVNDRGPFHGSRVMDVSWAAAAKLDMLSKGTAKITIEVVNSANSASTEIAQQDNLPIESATTQAENAAKFFVQVGAFGTKDNALNLQNKLATLVSMPIEISQAIAPTPIHKVQIGPFSDEESAEKARTQLAQMATGQLIIVKR